MLLPHSPHSAEKRRCPPCLPRRTMPARATDHYAERGAWRWAQIESARHPRGRRRLDRRPDRLRIGEYAARESRFSRRTISGSSSRAARWRRSIFPAGRRTRIRPSFASPQSNGRRSRSAGDTASASIAEGWFIVSRRPRPRVARGRAGHMAVDRWVPGESNCSMPPRPASVSRSSRATLSRWMCVTAATSTRSWS